MSWRTDDAAASRPWIGPTRPYDLVKEFAIALLVVVLLTVLLAALFSSPDEPQITLSHWAQQAPKDFVTTALAELDGTSDTATYGPPYVAIPGAGQKIGPLNLQQLGGVRIPVDTAHDFVLGPLSTVAASDPSLASAIQRWRTASSDQQRSWADAFGTALEEGSVSGERIDVPSSDNGPVLPIMQAELRLAASGGLEGAMLSRHAFYGTDYTQPLLFLADGSYLGSLADRQHLLGDQWGMMNESGSYPGQTWLWLYTLWYQVPPFSTSDNADALVWGLMLLLTAGFVLLPFIPGLRSLPRRFGAYRLIWRDYYRSTGHGDGPGSAWEGTQGKE
ncbi:MAG TPA: hypothetical protein VF984_05845 [Actinomycetota bacterium]